MNPSNLIVRCSAERKNGQWQILCLDFCLAAQADSFDEARLKLEAMIAEYVSDALIGEDRAFAPALLRRRAPLQDWAKYYVFSTLARTVSLKRRFFEEVIPLRPCGPTATA